MRRSSGFFPRLSPTGNRGTGIVRDYEKMNLAVVAGWRVLQVQPKDLMTTQTADWLRALLETT